MAILAGNIASRISATLQFRVFSIPWVNTNTAVLCLKGRDYSSPSVPVRYIPKGSSKSNEVENSSPKKRFENRVFDKSLGLDKKPQNRKRPSLVKLLFDDAQQVLQSSQNNAAVTKLEDEINHDLDIDDIELMAEHGQVTEEIRIQEDRDTLKQSMQMGKSMLDAEKLAVDLLAKRAFTAVELRKKLLGKRFLPDIVEAVMNNFQSRGLINDSLYAETFSRSRWSSSSWGPRRIKQALFSKGVSEADVEKALKLVFQGDESTNQESEVGLSKISMDHLLVQASKQWLRCLDAPKETRKSRIIRWLQYRGFSWNIISFVLKKLESQYPP